MMRCNPLTIVAGVLVLVWWASSAEASVSGKAFPVSVLVNWQSTSTRTFIFADDGGDPNSGSFGVMEGGAGTWQQLPLGDNALWVASYNDGPTAVWLIGVQQGTGLRGFGLMNGANWVVFSPWSP